MVVSWSFETPLSSILSKEGDVELIHLPYLLCVLVKK